MGERMMLEVEGEVERPLVVGGMGALMARWVALGWTVVVKRV